MLLSSPCRFVSDAVTGVAIVIILFFFPSQKPSLRWWFDFKGKMVTAGAFIFNLEPHPMGWHRPHSGRALHGMAPPTKGLPSLVKLLCKHLDRHTQRLLPW